MHVETLIYAYLAICLAMIVFNCACIFVYRHQGKMMQRYSEKLVQKIEHQILLSYGRDTVSNTHLMLLQKKLQNINNLIAFDKTLETLIEKEGDSAWEYIKKIHTVFSALAIENNYKDTMQFAYFAYVIAKYHILAWDSMPVVVDLMLKLLEQPSLYCRENAMQAIYSSADHNLVLKALHRIDECGRFHHEKLLTDGLVSFTGSHSQLTNILWKDFDTFSNNMQVVIVDYIRFSGTSLNDEILHLLASENRHDELRFACIRYFWKHTDKRAYPILLSFLEHPEKHRWEYAAISATALSSYPNQRTIIALKSAMNHQNWYIRLNAAKTLESFNLTYHELGDVMEGKDRYAREILQYQLDIQRAKQMEEVQV